MVEAGPRKNPDAATEEPVRKAKEIGSGAAVVDVSGDVGRYVERVAEASSG